MNERSNPGQTLQVGFAGERTALFDQIFNTFLKGYSTSNLLYANLCIPFFLASLILPENLPKVASAPAAANPTDQAIQYMQNHLSEPVVLDNIAHAAHLSTSFFCRKFKRDTGYTPIAYFNHLRVQKACQLLHFSNLRINEVASQIGIDDPFYFSRLFKKQIGVSPVEYRKNESFIQ
jgi:AraC-like DNA-binding protein